MAEHMNQTFDGLEFAPAQILLPEGKDWSKWAVVACDQFTSQPEYWESVEKFVGDAPSTLRLILPEYLLAGGEEPERVKKINGTMEDYLADGTFSAMEDSLVYVERVQSDGKVRRGLVGRIDLENYDYNKGSVSSIRATEGTVLERIPPRQAVRRNAPVELPHVMLLIDDKENAVIGPLTEAAEKEAAIYDFDLMEGGGHIKGWKVGEPQYPGIAAALRALKENAAGGLLFAVGDGNHSLASAKACYEEQKAALGEAALALPSRWALVEVVNLYDEALVFEPIHRVLFDVDPEDVLAALKAYYPGAAEENAPEKGHVVEFVFADRSGFITIPQPEAKLPVGSLQRFLDDYFKDHEGGLDYIHDEVARDMGRKDHCMAFMLEAMDKEDLFPAVAGDGALPRKTFSMGHAADKRYYLEARKIK